MQLFYVLIVETEKGVKERERHTHTHTHTHTERERGG